jgi:hypothetical protein
MDRVSCYWNLHRDLWSIKRPHRRVTHARSLLLIDCTFVVWQGGCERARRERKKNVHAFARGTYVGSADRADAERNGMVRVSYNPFRNPDAPGSFYVVATGRAVTGARALVLLPDGTVYALDPVERNPS